MNTRQQMVIRIALVLGILVLLNILAVRFFTRFDLTADHLYTLSDASKNLVASLDDRFTVKAYFTDDLPPPYNNNRRYQLVANDHLAYSNHPHVHPQTNPLHHPLHPHHVTSQPKKSSSIVLNA